MRNDYIINHWWEGLLHVRSTLYSLVLILFALLVLYCEDSFLIHNFTLTEDRANIEVEAPLEKEIGLVTPKSKVSNFEDLSFATLETQQYKCYLAVSLCDEHLDAYGGFIFLERGQLIWNTTKCTVMFCKVFVYFMLHVKFWKFILWNGNSDWWIQTVLLLTVCDIG